MVKAEGYTNFTFRFDDALREDAERFAKAARQSLGAWVTSVIEKEIKELKRAEPPRKRPK